MTTSTDKAPANVAINDIGTAEELLAAVEKTLKFFNDGDLIEGVVVKIDRDEVLLDVGYKTEGVIPSRELSIRHDADPSEIVSVGDTVEALVLQKEDKEGRLILSKKRAQYERAWGDVEKIKEADGTVEGMVIEVVKGGLIVDIGLRGFLPASLIELRRVRDLAPYLGQKVEAKILELDKNRNNVVLIEQLAEHFNAGNNRLNRVFKTNDLDFFADLNNAALDTTGNNRTATRDREHVFNRHQEGLILRTLWLWNIRINGLHELKNSIMADFWTLVFKRANRRALGDWNIIAWEIILRKQFADLKLNQLDQLGVIHQINLVHEHNKRRNANLTGQQNMLAGLGHWAVGSRHHQDRAIHLCRTRDHVLHIIGVAGAIDVGVVASSGLVFNVSRRNRNTTGLFFRRLINLVIRGKRRAARFSQHLRDSSRQ
jgi:predicted RNA-binding protein with RPS1 domain